MWYELGIWGAGDLAEPCELGKHYITLHFSSINIFLKGIYYYRMGWWVWNYKNNTRRLPRVEYENVPAPPRYKTKLDPRGRLEQDISELEDIRERMRLKQYRKALELENFAECIPTRTHYSDL